MLDSISSGTVTEWQAFMLWREEQQEEERERQKRGERAGTLARTHRGLPRP